MKPPSWVSPDLLRPGVAGSQRAAELRATAGSDLWGSAWCILSRDAEGSIFPGEQVLLSSCSTFWAVSEFQDLPS